MYTCTTGCYICNEGKEELGECISWFKILKREIELSEKNVEKWRSLQFDNKTFTMEGTRGQQLSASKDFVLGTSGNVAMVSDCHSGVCMGGTAGI